MWVKSSLKIYIGILGTLIILSINAFSEENCTNLSQLELKNAKITLAEQVPKGEFTAPNGRKYPVEEFCRIRGVSVSSDESRIVFEVWLPVSGWTGRYHQFDPGSMGGSLSYEGLSWRLNKGDAVAARDILGLSYSSEDVALRHSLDLMINVNSLTNYGYRGHRVTAENGKKITEAYYESPPHHSYFSGCSSGGFSAFKEAQAFPDDWDGILAGAPSNNILQILFGTWPKIALAQNVIGPNIGDTSSRITLEKLPAIQAAAVASCSGEAHVINGIPADPRFCRYDPKILACTDKETDECLTESQVKTLRGIYEEPKLASGEVIFPGVLPSFESYQWPGWIIPIKVDKKTVPGSRFQEYYQSLGKKIEKWLYGDRARIESGFLKYYSQLIQKGDYWSPKDYDLEEGYLTAMATKYSSKTLSSLIALDHKNLKQFKDKGGKILMYHGWADPASPAEGAIEYFNNVVNDIGNYKATDSFLKLYMMPGMGHCTGGDGANQVGASPFMAGNLHDDAKHDMVRSLEAWVEEGAEPDEIVAVKYLDNRPESGVEFTRPLCVYPKVRVYKGVGEISKASSFKCETGITPLAR